MLTRAVVEVTNVPVIASGGVGTLDHLVEGVLEGKADAVLGRLHLPLQRAHRGRAKALHMAAAGIPVRPADA